MRTRQRGAEHEPRIRRSRQSGGIRENALTTILRQLLLFGHTLAFAFAIVAVLRGDWALLRADHVVAEHLRATGREVFWMLVLLWLTGCTLVALDTGFDPAALAARPKLAAKLTVVLLLSANGMLLHRLAFPVLMKAGPVSAAGLTLCAVLGAVSSVTWLYASFIGVSRLIAPSMSFTGFLALYGLLLAVGVLLSMAFVRPRLVRLIGLRSAAAEGGAGPNQNGVPAGTPSSAAHAVITGG